MAMIERTVACYACPAEGVGMTNVADTAGGGLYAVLLPEGWFMNIHKPGASALFLCPNCKPGASALFLCPNCKLGHMDVKVDTSHQDDHGLARGHISFSVEARLTEDEARRIQEIRTRYHPDGYGFYGFETSPKGTTWKCASSCD